MEVSALSLGLMREASDFLQAVYNYIQRFQLSVREREDFVQRLYMLERRLSYKDD